MEHQQYLLNKILENPNTESEIVELISICTNEGKSTTLSFLSSIKSNLKSQTSSSFTRLQCVRILKSLMQVNKSSIISSVQQEIMPSFLNYVLNQRPSEGFLVWIRLLQLNDKSEFKAYILLLQCIESWAGSYPSFRNGDESEFLKAFRELCEKNTEFPPSFFLKSLECEQGVTRKDLKRVEMICQELLKALACLNKGKSSTLKKVLISYEKSLKEISRIKENKAITQLLEKINHLLNLFKSIKSTRFQKLPEDQGKLKLSRLIDDPYPKSSPMDPLFIHEIAEENSHDDHESILKPRTSHKRSCTSKCISNHSKLTKYKEKIRHLKQSQADLQAKFSSLSEINTKLTQENEASGKIKKDLDTKLSLFESKLSESEIQIEEKNTQINFLEKQLHKQKKHSNNLKLKLKNLENSYKILQIENEKNKKFLETESLNHEAKTHRPKESEDSSRIKKSSSKRILEKARVAAINLRYPHFSYLPQKNSHLSHISDSDSEKVLGDESSDLKIPNISLDLTEKYLNHSNPSKTSRISKSRHN